MKETMLEPEELARVDQAMDEALERGDAGGLPVIGAGEISVALAWPPEQPRAAVKLATCRHGTAPVAEHAELIADYRSALADRGVVSIPTAVQLAPSGRGYLVQPLLDPGAIAERHVADDPSRARWVLDQVVDNVVAAVGSAVGLDPQLANWAVTDDGVVLVDVGSPMLRDAAGRDRIDLEPYYASTPVVLRPVIRRIGPDLLASYHDRRGSLTDLGFNLIKAGLEQHCATVVELTTPYLDEPLTVEEIHRAYRNDARLWQALQAVRRADRWWQRRVRRRTYPYLLPPPIDRRLGRRSRPG